METENQSNQAVAPVQIPEQLEAVIKATIEQTIAGFIDGKLSKRGRDRSRSRSRSRGGRSRSRSRGRRDRSRSRGRRDRSGSRGRRDRSTSREREGWENWEGYGRFPRHHHHFHHGPPSAWYGDEAEFPPRWGRRGRGKHGRRFPFSKGPWDRCYDCSVEKNDESNNQNEKEGTPAAEKTLTGDFHNIRVNDNSNEMD